MIPDDPFGPPPPVQQYHHLPQHLAEQLQNLPALAPVHGRGRGRGRAQGQVQVQLPVSVQVDFYVSSLIETLILSLSTTIFLLIWPNNLQLCQLCLLEE